MFKVRDVLQLNDGEQVRAVVRQHGMVLWPKLLLAGCLIVLPFFFLFPLSQHGVAGAIAFSLLLASGMLIALRAFLLWDAAVLLLTTDRLVLVRQQGVWSRAVSEVSLALVHEVAWERHGLFEHLWRIGTLRVTSSGTAAILSAPRLFRPERVQEQINVLRKPFLDRLKSQQSEQQEFQRTRDFILRADGETVRLIAALVRSRLHGDRQPEDSIAKKDA